MTFLADGRSLQDVALTDSPTGGAGPVPFKRISTADVNSAVVKASQARLYAIVASNLNAADRYLKLYNKATAPTVGTDVPVMTLVIPKANAPTVIPLGDIGLLFTLGLGIGITTGIADSDVAAVAANEIMINLSYA